MGEMGLQGRVLSPPCPMEGQDRCCWDLREWKEIRERELGEREKSREEEESAGGSGLEL